MRLSKYRHEFVDYIPARLEEGVLYVSIPFTTAVHQCFCGCGEKVVTPITPTDWHLMFDGESVSLDPSVGSWSLPCRSHYWVKRGLVDWAQEWTHGMIDRERVRDRQRKLVHYEQEADSITPAAKRARESLWHRVMTYLSG